MNELLERLLEPEWEADYVASTAEALRVLLRRSPEVHEIREAYDAGAVTAATLRQFVQQMLAASSADSMPHEHALAAIAVVLEDRFTGFSEEYLVDLARVRTARLAMASRVARVCLRKRSRYAKTEAKRFVVDEGNVREMSFSGFVLSGWEATESRKSRITTYQV